MKFKKDQFNDRVLTFREGSAEVKLEMTVFEAGNPVLTIKDDYSAASVTVKRKKLRQLAEAILKELGE